MHQLGLVLGVCGLFAFLLDRLRRQLFSRLHTRRSCLIGQLFIGNGRFEFRPDSGK